MLAVPKIVSAASRTPALVISVGRGPGGVDLDQLRPIFPLKTLTVLALHESSLRLTVQSVASRYGIRVQEDSEPERNLLQRSDHFSFM